ncbi:sensor histidine kinase [Paenibacillus sp. 32O-W]|uniref:sensor histidine kinase n=1 Tax=Paenibacillus sp. 32O-W TaxID=1695218 RepID=UPI0011A4EDA3|nr:sensor histidine kinase [Paenibacillus sp. 32O-W]
MIKMTALSLKTKLLLLILLLVLPYLFFNIFTYIRLEKQIEINAMHYSEQLVQQLSSRLDTYFEDLDRSSLPVIVHPLVQQLMDISPAKDNYRLFHLSERIREEVIPSVIFERPEIYGFKIVSDQGAAVGNFRGLQNESASANHWGGFPDDRYTIIGIHYLDSTPILTIARKFLSTPSFRHSGLLVFELRLNHLTQHFREVELGPSGSLQVINENQQVLFHSQEEKIGQLAENTAPELLNGPAIGSFITRSEQGEKRIISFHRSEPMGLTVISEVPYVDLTSESGNVRHMNMWIHLAFIAVIILGVGFFSLSLTRSVSHLQKLMRQAETGNLHVKAPENRQDEIGRLNRSFNHMVGQIKHLIEVIHKSELREKEGVIRQREAMLLAMQAQINPHFLYNTLEIINSYAIVQEVMPISRMATALGEMFRYSFNKQAQVSLRDELEHVRRYLEIQSERYPQLDIQMMFDDYNLNAVKAVRLIVQPIVENAFKHGYQKNRIKPDYIGISGKACPDGYRIIVSDRGMGMEPGQIEHFNRQFRHTSNEQTRTEGIGLWNVHQRIRLTYGKPYGLTIIRSGARGTDIEMKLPYT